MKNKYAKRSRISEGKVRELVRYFAADLTALQAATLSGLNRNTVNRLYRAACGNTSWLPARPSVRCSGSSRSTRASSGHAGSRAGAGVAPTARPSSSASSSVTAKSTPRSRISHRRIVWSLIIYCKQTVMEIFGKRQKYRVFFRSGPFFVRRREGLHGFGEPLQGVPCRRPVFPVLQHIDDRLVG